MQASDQLQAQITYGLSVVLGGLKKKTILKKVLT